MGKLLDYLIYIEELNEKTEPEKQGEASHHFITHWPLLGPEALEKVKDHLLTLDEFKNVKKINVLKAPSYLGDKDTLLPLNLDEDNLGDTTNSKFILIPNYLYSPDETNDIEFNEEMDIYAIELTPPIYDPNFLTSLKLGPGVWKMPLIYNPENFLPVSEIRIIYSVEGLQDILFDKNPEEVKDILKERIMNKVEEMLTSYSKPNVPVKRKVIFRVSPRSIKTKEKEQA